MRLPFSESPLVRRCGRETLSSSTFRLGYPPLSCAMRRKLSRRARSAPSRPSPLRGEPMEVQAGNESSRVVVLGRMCGWAVRGVPKTYKQGKRERRGSGGGMGEDVEGRCFAARPEELFPERSEKVPRQLSPSCKVGNHRPVQTASAPRPRDRRKEVAHGPARRPQKGRRNCRGADQAAGWLCATGGGPRGAMPSSARILRMSRVSVASSSHFILPPQSGQTVTSTRNT